MVKLSQNSTCGKHQWPLARSRMSTSPVPNVRGASTSRMSEATSSPSPSNMKEQRTEYERETEEKTVIQCDKCSTRWESRSADGCNLIVLNCKIGKRRSFGRSASYRTQSFDRSLWSDERYQIDGEDSTDLCNSCWSEEFNTSSAMEITEEDYYLDEKTTNVYYCDFCNDELGESVDNTVSVNPRILTGRTRSTMRGIREEPDMKVETNSMHETVSVGSRESAESQRDECHDVCESCKDQIFGYDTTVSTGVFKSMLDGFSSAFYKLV